MWGPFVHTQLLTSRLLLQCDTRINAWHPREGGRHHSAVEHTFFLEATSARCC